MYEIFTKPSDIYSGYRLFGIGVSLGVRSEISKIHFAPPLSTPHTQTTQIQLVHFLNILTQSFVRKQNKTKQTPLTIASWMKQDISSYLIIHKHSKIPQSIFEGSDTQAMHIFLDHMKLII